MRLFTLTIAKHQLLNAFKHNIGMPSLRNKCKTIVNTIFLVWWSSVIRRNNLLSALRLQGIKLWRCFLKINSRLINHFIVLTIGCFKCSSLMKLSWWDILYILNRLKSLMTCPQTKLLRYTDVVLWLICVVGRIYQTLLLWKLFPV